MTALYLTIWLALAGFVAGDTARSMTPRGAPPPAWAWWTFTFGLLLAIVHTFLAFHLVHHWIHADAVRATAAQTDAVFGVSVGWGVYVNYLFLATWTADAWWWRAASPGFVRPAAATSALRAFYLLIIVNAAVIFVQWPRPVLGILMVSWLVRTWSRPVRSSHPAIR